MSGSEYTEYSARPDHSQMQRPLPIIQAIQEAETEELQVKAILGNLVRS